jgi:hypothetical protein
MSVGGAIAQQFIIQRCSSLGNVVSAWVIFEQCSSVVHFVT